MAQGTTLWHIGKIWWYATSYSLRMTDVDYLLLLDLLSLNEKFSFKQMIVYILKILI